jgi:hypothetical protein
MRAARTWAAAGAACLVLTFASAAAAQRTYVVSSCQADGRPAPATAWTPSYGFTPDPDFPTFPQDHPIVDTCQRGGSFGVELEPIFAWTPMHATWEFNAPPNTVITSFSVWRNVEVDPGSFAILPPRYALRIDGDAVESAEPEGTLQLGSSSFDERSRRTVSGIAARAIAFGVSCPLEQTVCRSQVTTRARVARADVTLRDDQAPTVSGPSSTTLEFADRGGGVQTAALVVDGAQHSEIAFCHTPFVDRVPCPTTGRVVLPLDTSALAAGLHAAHIVLTDAAGNRTIGAPFEIEVPAALGGVAPAVLSLSQRRPVRVTFSSPPRLSGTLRDIAGTPLAGARIAMSSRPLAGGPWSAPVSVVTDGRGRFSVRLLRGVSREVRFAYGDASQTVKVIVAAPVRLSTDRKHTRNGRSVRFVGRVPGAGKARTRVELQAWVGKWQPFRTTALRNGRFRASYRFTRTFATKSYRFRAVIHHDPDFPYAAGRSRVVRVLVRP